VLVIVFLIPIESKEGGDHEGEKGQAQEQLNDATLEDEVEPGPCGALLV
jgi:hypothetical protein